MKKILIIAMNLYNGGAEKSLVNLLNEIDYSKYQIDLLLFQKKGLFLRQVPSKVNIIDEPMDLYFMYNNPKISDFNSIKKVSLIFSRVFYTIFSRIRYRKGNLREIKQIRWDKFYKKKISTFNTRYDVAISYLENEPMRYLVDKVSADKKYAWLHNDYKSLGLNKKYDVYYYNKVDKVVTISDRCLNVFNEVFPDFYDKSIYIPNISSSSVIRKLAEEPLEIMYKKNAFKIISIGRLDIQKGFDLAVKAAKILMDNGVNFQWFVIGDGPMYKEICDKIKKYHLENRFELIGTTDNPYTYIRNSDILVQSSRFEGKSIVLDEAKILGKTFVVTKYPTVYDQASENIAVLVDISPEGIANGIMELYNNREKVSFLESNLKSENYGNENGIDKYYQLFDE